MNDTPHATPKVGIAQPTPDVRPEVLGSELQGSDMDNPTREVVDTKERRIEIRGPLHGGRMDGPRLVRSVLIRELPDGWMFQYAGGPCGTGDSDVEALIEAFRVIGVEVDIRPLTTDQNYEFVFAKAVQEATR